MIYVHVHMWREVSLFWETHTKLSLSEQERVLILECMKVRQLSLENDGIVGTALGCGLVGSNWISHHIPVLVLIQSLIHLSGTLSHGSIDLYYTQNMRQY